MRLQPGLLSYRCHFYNALDTDAPRMGAVLAHIALLYKIEKHARRNGIAGEDLRLLREHASQSLLDTLHKYLETIETSVCYDQPWPV